MSTSLKVSFSSIALLGSFSAFASESDAGAVVPKEETAVPGWEKRIVALVKKSTPCNGLDGVVAALDGRGVNIEVVGQDGKRNTGLEWAILNYYDAVKMGADTSWFNPDCLSNHTVKATKVNKVNVKSEAELDGFGENLVGSSVSWSYKGDLAAVGRLPLSFGFGLFPFLLLPCVDYGPREEGPAAVAGVDELPDARVEEISRAPLPQGVEEAQAGDGSVAY
ncbi:MAG: hypothetical protein LBF72_00975 [Holosporales bacterium]|nr:hypothetical protein [Holosporales bacterium]